MPQKIAFTPARIGSLELPPAGKRTFVYDTKQPGLALRLTGAGARSWYLVRRVPGGPAEQVRLGDWPGMTVDQARKAAADACAVQNAGRPVIAEKRAQAARAVADKARGATLNDAWLAYRGSRPLRPNTLRLYELSIGALADWSDRPIASITRDEVEVRHAELTKTRGPALANSTARVLRAVLNFATDRFVDEEGRPVQPDNPVRRLSIARAWNRVERRTNYIRAAGMPDWWAALDRSDSAVAADYLRMLLLTGCRRMEIAALRWADVDLQARTLTIPGDRAKNHQPHTLPLGPYAAALLARRKAGALPGAVFAFPGTGSNRTGHLAEPKRAILTIGERAGVPFTCHDLRRTFATVCDELGLPMLTTKRLMNHRSAGVNGGDVTAGYVQSDVERLRAPMEQIEAEILRRAGVTYPESQP